ncbi:unnamed protein product [Miscanthus lutarioriparius]|uniref:Cytochrome P450 n=1 Tax=Miscanthus lutarioriparius TaxID=422564 RepID=A0A811SRL1_9POAL|nr:unnamed protein product [Miscanthus lutarioriparius]
MEISGTSALTIFLFLVPLLILVSSLRANSNSSSKKRRPPGPRAFPLVGSIHHMLTSQPQAALWDLAERHGPVMLLRLGQEVLQGNDLSFASRPSLVASEIICYGHLDLAFAPYGDYWRALRKLCVLELLSARKVRHFAPIRDSETMSLVAEIRAAAAADGDGEEAATFNLGKLLVSCTNSITGLATFGDGCSGERKEQFLSAMAVVLSHASGFSVSDLFPSLWFVDVLTGTIRRLWRAHRQLDELFDKIIEECEARWKDESAAAGDNLLSIMLRVRDNEEFAFPFGNANIKAIIVDLFIAGTETISSTAEWVMSELIRHPESMAKAQAEVRTAFNNIIPQHHESHMDALHYTRLVIKETLRLHPSVPLLLPRLCRKTCDIGGFEVTEGSRKPEYWGDDAEEFRPTRFESSVADYQGTEFQYLPFGSGRRMCPGSAFGMATLELVVARLLYYFDWSLPGTMRPEELDMETIVGGTARRRNQLHLVATLHDVPVQS